MQNIEDPIVSSTNRFEKFNKEFSDIYLLTNSDEKEILINAVILFVLMVMVMAVLCACFVSIKPYFEKSDIGSSKEKPGEIKEIDEWSPEAVVTIPLNGDTIFRTPDLINTSIFQNIQVFSDSTNEASSKGKQGTSTEGLLELETEYRMTNERLETTSDITKLMEDLDLVMNEGNLSSFLSQNFEIDDCHEQLRNWKYQYTIRELRDLQKASSKTNDYLDERWLDERNQRSYSRDDIFEELNSFASLTETFTRFNSSWEAEKYIREVKVCLMNHKYSRKNIFNIMLLSVGVNSIHYRNPNIFLGGFTELISEIISSGIIVNLFQPEMQMMILGYIYCHWYFSESDVAVIQKQFRKWSAPLVIKQKGSLFRYLITLKIAGHKNKTIDRFLLHLDLDSSFTTTINEALRITDDQELINLLLRLKKKCLDSTRRHIGLQKPKVMPGSFSGW